MSAYKSMDKVNESKDQLVDPWTVKAAEGASKIDYDKLIGMYVCMYVCVCVWIICVMMYMIICKQTLQRYVIKVHNYNTFFLE